MNRRGGRLFRIAKSHFYFEGSLLRIWTSLETRSPIGNYKKTFLKMGGWARKNWESEFSLDCGSDVSARDVFGSSGLAYAVSQRSYDMVELLTQSERDPELEDKKGRTPLMVAGNAGNVSIKKLLQDASSR
jgi:ankyrin repeat protein